MRRFWLIFGILWLSFAAFIALPARSEDAATASGNRRSASPIDTEVTKKRIALIIGNSEYETLIDLRNPANDARALGAVLRRLNFEVTVGLDLEADAFRKTIQRFLERIDQDTAAVFFYAGHGLQANGVNYMLPTDAKVASLSDLEFETIRFNLVLEPLEQNSDIGIVFLDACRNNPLANLARTGKNRSLLTRGLAPVQTGDGLFIGFATQPDNVAADGDGPNSPFTTALLRHLETKNLDVEMLMRRVRDDVLTATERAQIPWSNSSLSSEGFSFNPARIDDPVAITDPQSSNTSDRQMELELWRSISASDDDTLYESYLKRYPDGTFADIAKQRLKARQKKIDQAATSPGDAVVPVKKPVGAAKKKTTTVQKKEAAPQRSTNVQSGTRCRDGNVARCRQRCAQGEKRACDKLKRLGL